MNKLIGIDLADTIINVWPNSMITAALFNDKYAKKERRKVEFYYLPEHIYDWNQEDINNFYSKYRDEINFNSPVLPYVKESLLELKMLKYTILIITAKTNNNYIDLENKIIDLLKSNGIIYDYIYTQISNKGVFCKENNISYLIDDSYDNCLSALQNGVNSILLTKPYNENRNLVDGMVRVNDFRQAKEYIIKKVK